MNVCAFNNNNKQNKKQGTEQNYRTLLCRAMNLWQIQKQNVYCR